MKFRLTKSSDYKYDSRIDINTIEELIDLINKKGKIIISICKENGVSNPEIEIYDDYRE